MKPLFDRYRPEPRWHVLQDRWVTLRSIQHCYRCREELAHRETARLEVVSGPGEFWSVYSCWTCNDGRGQALGWTRDPILVEQDGPGDRPELEPASQEEVVL